ncbi:MAG: glycoside hydrolase family 3 protein [Candidatus Delongbacteria bacterium]|nr:glycoside hydrolase family 3 protein [Candidatus Delongbacteria bacterium]
MAYSLEQMIGQMVIVGFRSPYLAADSPILRSIREHGISGVYLTDNDKPWGSGLGNIVSPSQFSRLNHTLQQQRRESGNPWPLFITMDAEGGIIIRLKEKYGFPATLSAFELGRQDQPELTRRQSDQIAQLLASSGVNFNFVPVLDLNINPANPAIGAKQRSFSDDPERVVRHAVEVIQAHHDHNILCCAKHFPGHGSAPHDTHLGMVDCSRFWSEKELIPYRRLIERRILDAVMISHLYNRKLDPDYPATLSRRHITGLLRDQLGFEGLIISDDISMGALHNYYSYQKTIELALNAGIDILLHSNVSFYQPDLGQQIVHIVRNLVETGRVRPEIIETAFRRIIVYKQNFYRPAKHSIN